MTGTICKLRPGNRGEYYTLGNNYYLKSGEDAGLWVGRGAARLKLAGAIDSKSFGRLLDGCNPRTGKPLLGRRYAKRVPAVDIHFAGWKALSVVWACSPEPDQDRIKGFNLESVQFCLRFIERFLPLVRTGAGGAVRQKGELTAGLFVHYTSRNQGDPQLHVHAVIPNLSWDGRSKFRHLNTIELYSWTRTLGPMFRMHLAHLLKTQMHLQLDAPAGGSSTNGLTIRGVPDKLCRIWSSRRREIDDLVSEQQKAGMQATAKTRSWANQKTRQSKDRLPGLQQLQEKWLRVADQLGFDIRQLPTARPVLHRRRFEKLFRRALRDAIRGAHEDQAHFPVRLILQKVFERMEHTGFHPRMVVERIDQALSQQRDLVHLQGEGFNRILTTRKMWQMEEKLLADCDVLRERTGARVRSSKLDRILADHSHLSGEQVEALKHLTQQKGALRLLQGVAGAGKSRTLDAVRDAFERSGFRVLGGAISGIAKQNLAEQAGIESRTIASYLYHMDRSVGRKICDRLIHDLKQLVRAARDLPTTQHQPLKLTRKTVLILDEAGMNDSHSFGALVRLVRKAGATLILVGDSKQLQPIGPGGVFPYLLAKYTHASLKTNRRQQSLEDREAVERLREGESRKAIESYRSRNLLTLKADHLASAKALIAAWVEAGGVEIPKDHAILAQTRKEARILNLSAQEERKRAGELNAARSVVLHETCFYERDRIMFHKRLPMLHIENGHQGEIVRICPLKRSITVRLDQPKPGTSPVVHIPYRMFEAAETSLGYAATTHKFQGATTEYAYVLMGGTAVDRNMAYTQLTRAREKTRIFVSEPAAGDNLEDLVRSTSRERAKRLAHDLRQQNQ